MRPLNSLLLCSSITHAASISSIKPLFARDITALQLAEPSGPARASKGEAPSNAVITSTSYNGDGCPPGSVSVILTEDRSTATFGFDKFQATIGPRAPKGDNLKECRLKLQLDYPDGYQLSIVQTTYHGYTRLDDGVSATFESSYWFQRRGNGKRSRTKVEVQGGGEAKRGKGVKQRKDNTHDDQEGRWSVCGKDALLNVENSIALFSRNATAEGEITRDDATVKLMQELQVTWRKCQTGGGNGGNGAKNGGGKNNGPPKSINPSRDNDATKNTNPGKGNNSSNKNNGGNKNGGGQKRNSRQRRARRRAARGSRDARRSR